MKVINFFAEPSAGKSTTAAGLFFLMKRAGLNVELVNEYAKTLVWSGRIKTFSDQLYITAKQNHKLEMLRGQVDYVISDSPLILGIVYKGQNTVPSFNSLVKETFDTYDNFNIFLSRSKKYNPIGRNENEEQAKSVREKIEKALNDFGVPFVSEIANDDAPKRIFQKYFLTKE